MCSVEPRVSRVHRHASRRTPRLLRCFVACTLLLSLLLPSLAFSHVTAQDSSAGVPMEGGNPARTGELPGPGPDPNQPIGELWQFNTKGLGFGFDRPIVVDRVVYAGSEDGNLYAIDADTGQQLWTFDTGRAGVPSSPQVADGTVFICDADGPNLYAIDATSGQQRWAFTTAYDSSVFSPTVVDGVVFVGSSDDSFYAIDAQSGQQRWNFETGDSIVSISEVVDGIVYIGSTNGTLYAIDVASGQQQWTFKTEGKISAPATVVNGIVYLSSYDGSMYAIDASSGQQRWVLAGLLSFGKGFNALTIVDGTVFATTNTDIATVSTAAIGDINSDLYAVDATSGQQRWAFTTLGMELFSPVVVDGIVYTGKWDGHLYAFDATSGQQRWTFTTDGGIGSPTVVDGIIIVSSNDGSFYAINATSGQRSWGFTTGDDGPYSSSMVVGGVVYVGSTNGSLYALGNPSWKVYFLTDLRSNLGTVTSNLPGLTLSSTDDGPLNPYLPTDYVRGANYHFSIAGGSASAWVALAILPSTDDADATLANLSGGLLRSGWQAADTDLGHTHACLTVVHADTSEAVCYVTRDDALIASHSDVNLPSPDAALLNATDLAKAMNDAYDQVDRPD